MNKAFLEDINTVLLAGGLLRFYWATCRHELQTVSGEIIPVDGRSYHAFIAEKTDGIFAYGVTRTESGSMADKTLVFEWRKA